MHNNVDGRKTAEQESRPVRHVRRVAFRSQLLFVLAERFRCHVVGDGRAPPLENRRDDLIWLRPFRSPRSTGSTRFVPRLRRQIGMQLQPRTANRSHFGNGAGFRDRRRQPLRVRRHDRRRISAVRNESWFGKPQGLVGRPASALGEHHPRPRIATGHRLAIPPAPASYDRVDVRWAVVRPGCQTQNLPCHHSPIGHPRRQPRNCDRHRH